MNAIHVVSDVFKKISLILIPFKENRRLITETLAKPKIFRPPLLVFVEIIQTTAGIPQSMLRHVFG